MSAAARRKGAQGEREACALLHGYGWPYARRTLQSGARGGGDIESGPRGLILEVKRHGGRLDLPAAFRQAQSACVDGLVPAVLHRRDGEDWLVTMPAGLVLELLAEREGLRARAEQREPEAPTLLSPASPYDPGTWA